MTLTRENLAIVKAAAADRAPEAVIVPLGGQRLHILPNDGLTTSPALGRATLGTASLARDTPGIPVLFNVRGTRTKRVTALGTEEVTNVPVLAESYNVLANNGRGAVLAARCKLLVPVQMAEETQAVVAVLAHSLARGLLQNLATGTPGNPMETGIAKLIGLW